MNTGISTACFFPMLTEKALEELLKKGTKTLEIFFNSPCESNKEFMLSLMPMINHYKARIVSLHPCTSAFETLSFFGKYERRFYDSIESYKRLFEVCNLLDSDILVFHGAKKKFHIEEELYFERFQKLCQEGKKAGVNICQENVEGFSCGDADFMSRLLKQLPDTKTVFDVKQCVRNNLDPFYMLDVMGKSVYHVHLSDHDKQNVCMLPGRGSFDFKKFFLRLKSLEFDKNVIIELYSNNFDSGDELIAAKGYINQIIRDVQKN